MVSAITREADGAECADPDVELLRATASGDFDAFERLVERHQERLLRTCERLLGDREAARDAVQEVFLKVYRKASSFRPRAKVSTWIYRIAVNHCFNQLRRRKIVSMIPFSGLARDDEDASWEPRAEDPDPHRTLEGRRRWAETRRALNALPMGQRAVLVLARFEGLSYKEIAQALGITLGAVESRLFRAMRNLERAQETAGSGVQ